MITAASWCRQPHSINVDDRLTHTAQLEGCGNGVTVEPLRHRQTKEAATDMFDLQPPRHISTLPLTTGRILAADCRFRGATDMFGPAACPTLSRLTLLRHWLD